MKANYLRTTDGRLYYQEMGQGAPIIFVHGNGQSHRVFLPFAQKLGDDFRCILMDSRGHGRSTFGRRPLTIATMVNDLELLRNKEGLDSCIIIGFSDGANIALEYAAKYPQHAHAAIAISPNLHPGGLKWWTRLALNLFQKLLLTLVYLKWPLQQQLKRTQLMLYQSDLTVTTLGQIRAATLVLTGKHDVVRLAHLKELVQHINNAQLVVVGNTHHLSLFRHIDYYTRLFSSFLSQYS